MEKEIPSGVKHYVIHYGLEKTIPIYSKHFPAQRKQIRVGIIARLVPQKNLSLAIHVIKILNTNSPILFSLDIVGRGPLLKPLEALVKSLDLQNLVHWKGITSNLELFFNSIDVFILTSDYEGFGLVLLEAMTFGVPVVSRKISAIPEVLGEDHPGLIDTNNPSDLAERIRQIIFSVQKWEECLQFQSRQLKEFSIEKTHQLHSLVYLDLIRHNL